MSATYTLISSQVLSSSTSSVTFSSIPSTYYDLSLKLSVRDSANNGDVRITINGDNGAYYSQTLYGNSSDSLKHNYASNTNYISLGLSSGFGTSGGYAAANEFGTVDITIPNYKQTSYYHNISAYWAAPTISSQFYHAGQYLVIGSTVSSITFTANTSFVTGSSFYLYGINNS